MSTAFHGTAHMEGCTYRAGAYFSYSEFRGDTDFSGSVFRHDTEFVGVPLARPRRPERLHTAPRFFRGILPPAVNNIPGHPVFGRTLRV